MKLFRIIGRSIRDSLNSIFRNLAFSLASIFCIMITLFMVSVSSLLAVNIDAITNIVKEDVTIVAYLDEDITEERIAEIDEILNGLDNLQTNLKEGEKAVKFNDKMAIREEYMESSEVYQDVMKDWETRDDNPLKDAFHIKVADIKHINETAEEIKKIEGVYSVKYGESWVENLVATFETIKNGSLIIVVALILVAAFLISNTIRITIFSRKKEIDIMRLVGASNTNIKIPFFFEGLFLGILGSLIPIACTMYGYTAIYDNFREIKLFGTEWLVAPNEIVYYVSFLLLGIGAVVGIIGSISAVKKHLKI